jgi:hypothetical protein
VEEELIFQCHQVRLSNWEDKTFCKLHSVIHCIHIIANKLELNASTPEDTLPMIQIKYISTLSYNSNSQKCFHCNIIWIICDPS